MRKQLLMIPLAGVTSIVFTACTSQAPVSPPETSAIPTSYPSPSASPSVEAAVARLEEFNPSVSFKRRKELVWQDVTPRMEFRARDSVQTQGDANASILLENGSVLSVSENSLVVIDSALKKDVDRAVIRKGELESQTKKELWILTSGALVKMKAASPGKSARLKLNLKDPGKLQVRMEEGQGELFRPSAGKGVERLVLPAAKPVKVDVPPAPVEVSWSEEELPTWAQQTALESARTVDPVPSRSPSPSPTPSLSPSPLPSPSPAAAPSPVAARQPDLVSLEPKDRSKISDSEVEIRGKVGSHIQELFLNGKPVQVRKDFTFAQELKLNNGANSVVLQMIRADGTVAFRRMVLIRED